MTVRIPLMNSSNNMKETIFTYIKQNKWPLLLGVILYAFFLKFVIEGNRICDCTTVEKYGTSNSGSRTHINRIYHK